MLIGLIGLTKVLVPSILVFITGWNLHKRELSKIKREADIDRQKLILEKAKIKEERDIAFKKLEYLPRIAALKNITKIQRAVDQIFKRTKATRFLILIGVNGKTSLNHVSCFWYDYKNVDDDINPLDAYKNIDISGDYFYRSMMRNLGKNNDHIEEIDVLRMPESILKDIYYEEQITYSRVGFLTRSPIDNDNDFLMYYSVATDSDEGDFTEDEKRLINVKVQNQIKPNV